MCPQAKFTSIKQKNEKLQMELMQTRLWQAEAVEEEEHGEEKEGMSHSGGPSKSRNPASFIFLLVLGN